MPTPVGEKLVRALAYLKNFGYLEHENPDENVIKECVKEFQAGFGLRETGLLDDKTLSAMLDRRCGVGDTENLRRWRPGNEEGANRWHKRSLTYFVESIVDGIPEEDALAIIDKMFQNWEAVCNLEIHRSMSSDADIVLSTGQGNRDNFDGPSGVLAWCQLPNGNDHQLLAKFDLAETWISDPRKRGILLLNCGCHEMGHGIGLSHTKVQGSLMLPYYSPSISSPQQDDIMRAQALYGRPAQVPSPTPTPVPVPTPTPPTDEYTVITIKGQIVSATGYRVQKIGG